MNTHHRSGDTTRTARLHMARVHYFNDGCPSLSCLFQMVASGCVPTRTGVESVAWLQGRPLQYLRGGGALEGIANNV